MAILGINVRQGCAGYAVCSPKVGIIPLWPVACASGQLLRRRNVNKLLAGTNQGALALAVAPPVYSYLQGAARPGWLAFAWDMMMKRLWKELINQLQYQIIFPFLLLTLLVMVAGASMVFFLMGQTLSDRFDRQLAEAARGVGDGLVKQEQANLDFLFEIAFAQQNEKAKAPAVAEALAKGDREGLRRAIEVFYNDGIGRSGVGLDRLIAFDQTGRTLADFERPEAGAPENYQVHNELDLNGAWFVEPVLRSPATDESLGDKYAGLIRFADTDRLYFATIAPVHQGEEVVGGIIVAMDLDSLLAILQQSATTEGLHVTLYDTDGALLGSTFAGSDPPPMSAELLSKFQANPKQFEQPLFSQQTLQNGLAGDSFQFAYLPMNVRGSAIGILAPSLSSDLMMEGWDSLVWPLASLIVILALVISGAGVLIARRITLPIEELAQASIDVSRGQLDRRADVRTENEIGQLAFNFNHMTEYLTRLYGQVQSEAVQRSAIVDSITDGIVVVDDQGYVQLINRATRRLMGLDEHEPGPTWLSDIPMQRVVEGMPGFDVQLTHDLYALGDYVVRATIAPVVDADQARSGYVCVLQDMTAEVAIYRAKNNFIGTISHELRTPLTVISGNADLLLRGLVGRLDDEQATFVESIRQNATNMASLLQNVITVANIDSGAITTDMAPLELLRPIDEAAWRVQSQIKAKGLTLTISIPQGLRPVLADFDHVRQVAYQLLDNARRYTTAGNITVRAADQATHVRVEVVDTGRGIAPDMQEQIFQRFIRGDGTSEGINSAERGIGLGLAIAKQLVERQGGTIGVSSVPGQGSTFFFTLCYADDTPNPEKTTGLATAA